MQALEFKNKINGCLNDFLIGEDAFMKLMPMSDGVSLRDLMPMQEATVRPSSVLLLFNKDFELPLTVRNPILTHHGGEVSFPGGVNEDGETSIEVALREANEEIGLNPKSVEVLGSLSNMYIPHSNTLITPILGFINEFPEFIPNEAEVSEIINVNLYELAFNSELKYMKQDFNGKSYHIPHWNIGVDQPLWGATAMILNELLLIIKHCKNS